jgi:multidrug resistance efflux pump
MARPFGGQILSRRIHGRYEAIHLRIQPTRFQQRQAALRAAQFDVEGATAEAENQRIIFERAKELRMAGVNAQRDLDDAATAYDVALARLSEVKAKVSQTTAAVAQAKDDLARGLANLGELEQTQADWK